MNFISHLKYAALVNNYPDIARILNISMHKSINNQIQNISSD